MPVPISNVDVPQAVWNKIISFCWDQYLDYQESDPDKSLAFKSAISKIQRLAKEESK